MRLWTDRFVQSGFDLPNDRWATLFVADMRRDSLCQRREELRQYELESYAAMWRKWETQIRCLQRATEMVLRHIIDGASDV